MRTTDERRPGHVTSPHLGDVEALVADLAAGDLTHREALAKLRARGLNPDPDALADAAEQYAARDGLIGGSVDPLVYLEVEPRPGLDAQAVAVAEAEDHIAWCVGVLARRSAEAVAS